MPYDRDHRDYEKDVNQATNHWEDKEPQCPENNQHQRYSEKHGCSVKVVSLEFPNGIDGLGSAVFQHLQASLGPLEHSGSDARFFFPHAIRNLSAANNERDRAGQPPQSLDSTKSRYCPRQRKIEQKNNP